MERYQEELEKAIKHITVADHMLVITYPLVKDPKLLLTILENISESLRSSICAVLHYALLYKQVEPFPGTPEGELQAFRELSKPRGLGREYRETIEQVRDILKEHKASPMEFARRETFVICGENYTLKTLSETLIKKYIARTKQFIDVTTRMMQDMEKELKHA